MPRRWLSFTRNQIPVVFVRIDGRRYEAMIDTGAFISMISPELSIRLGLPIQGQQPVISGADLDLIAETLEPRQQNWRTARLDPFIRAKANGLSWSENLSLLMSCGLVVAGLLGAAWSWPGWWYYLSMSFVFLVAHAWDRVAYRRISPEQRPTLQMPTLKMSEAPLPRANTTPVVIDAPESRPIHEWQRLYPGLWLLIEVTSEDEAGVSEGKLVTTAEDRSSFLKLDESYNERYMVAIYGRA